MRRSVAVLLFVGVVLCIVAGTYVLIFAPVTHIDAYGSYSVSSAIIDNVVVSERMGTMYVSIRWDTSLGLDLQRSGQRFELSVPTPSSWHIEITEDGKGASANLVSPNYTYKLTVLNDGELMTSSSGTLPSAMNTIVRRY